MATDAQLRQWYAEWDNGNGRTKSEIEVTELGDSYSHGKKITRLWRDRLGIETQEEHRLVAEVRRLKRLLDKHKISY